jgi:hypothetical protein
MYKGSLKIFSEVREELHNSAFKVWGKNLTADELEAIRSSYAYSSDVVKDRRKLPDCRMNYDTHRDYIENCYIPAVKYDSNRYVGWYYNKGCHFANGENNINSLGGSFQCPGGPNGQTYALVWFR